MDFKPCYAILLPTLANLVTSIGSGSAFLTRRPNYSYLSSLLGFPPASG